MQLQDILRADNNFVQQVDVCGTHSSRAVILSHLEEGMEAI